MRLRSSETHTVWDNSIAPVHRSAPGDIVEVEVAEASGGQVTTSSAAADLTSLDFSGLNPVTGPLHVEGAEPGDTLSSTCWTSPSTNGGGRATSPASGCSPRTSRTPV